MKIISYQKCNAESGFSLLEVAIAIVTLGVCLAYAMPLFLYAKTTNVRDDIRTGALLVSQRIFENIRTQPMVQLPSADGAIVNVPLVSSTPTTAESDLLSVNGRVYKVKVTYCTGVTSDHSICNDRNRTFKVEVFYNGSTVYDLVGSYTEFQ